MTASEFLQAFAAQTGLPVPSAEEIDELLELAGIAAHASERIAAPIACWIAGASGMPIPDLLTAARRVAPGIE